MKRFFVLCAALLAVVACNDSTGPGAVASIQVPFPPAPLAVGSTFQLEPVALDKNGNPSTADCVFTYSSSNPSVATVSATGLITAVADGATTISVETHGKVTSAQISVGAGGSSIISSLAIYPPTATIAVGQNSPLIAVAEDGDGNNVPLIPAPTTSPEFRGNSIPGLRSAEDAADPVQVRWTSSAPAIATVSNSGVVTGVSEGTATITAVSDGVVATSEVQIVSSTLAVDSISLVPAEAIIGVNSLLPLTATAFNESGVVLSGRVFTWTSSNNTVATVDRDGVVRGVSAGTATITVTSSGKTATAAVTVSASGNGSISLNTKNVSVGVSKTAPLYATVRDQHGAIVGTAVSFTSANPAIATIASVGSQQGMVTGVSAGSTTFSAAAGGLTATGTIAVTAAVVASVEVTPATVSMEVGQTQQFKAVAKDAGGVEIPGRSATWSTSDADVVGVSSSGMAYGAGQGTATVTATIDGITSTPAAVTILPRSISSLRISPAGPIEIGVGQSVKLSTTVYDAAQNEMPGIKVDYASNKEGVAIVTSTPDLLLKEGIVTGVSAGEAIITATAGGKTATVAVTVKLLGPSSISVVPPAACVPLGSAIQVVGKVLDEAGNVITAPIDWALSNPALGTITSNGLLKGLVSGTTNVVAKVGGLTETVSVTVCPATPASITISPSSFSLAVNGQQQLDVTVLDAVGKPIANPTISFSSSAAGVASVTEGGLVKGLTQGSAVITVKAGDKSTTANVTVTNAPVSSISISPSAVTLQPGGTAQLSPTLRDAQGNQLTGRMISYTSSDPTAATVDSSGLITAVAQGTTNISVTSEGVTQTVSVTVTQVPVATVDLKGPSLIVGLLSYVSPSDFVATPKDADGNVLTGRVCELRSSNPNVLNIGLTQIKVVGLGTSDVTAVCDGVTSNKLRVSVVSLLGL